MNYIDYESMDIAGYFFIEFALVPQAWFETQPKPVLPSRNEHDQVETSWWDYHEPAIPVIEYCDGRYTRTDITSYSILLDEIDTAWTDENNHRIQLRECDPSDTKDLEFLIDVRRPYSDFLDAAIRFSIDCQCLLFEYGSEKFFEPTRERIIELINNSISLMPLSTRTVDCRIIN